MFVRRFVASVVIGSMTTSALVAGAATSSAGEPAWTPPDKMAGSVLHTLAANGAGYAFTVFDAGNLSGSFTRDTSGAWTPWSDGYGGASLHHDAVVDRHGNTTVAWAAGGACDFGEDYSRYEDFEIAVAYRPEGRSWVRQSIPGHWDGCDESVPDLTVSPAGTVTAVWTGDGRLWAAQRPAGGRWTSPVDLGSPSATGAPSEYEVFAGRDGRTTVLWGGADGVAASTSSKLGVWGTPQHVAAYDSAATELSELQIADDSEGNLLAVWMENIGTFQEPDMRVRSVARPAENGWQQPRALVSPTGSDEVKNVDLAVNDLGATVVWYQGNTTDTAGSVRALTRSHDGRWASTQTVLAPSLTAWTRPSVAATAADVMVVWSAGGDSGAYPVVARRRSGGTWASPARLAAPSALKRDNWDYRSDRSPVVFAYRSNMLTAVYRRERSIVEYRDFVDDTTPPVARIVKPGRSYLGFPWMTVSWSGTDDLTGPRGFDVRVRSAGRLGSLSDWSALVTRTRATSKSLEVRSGRTYCFAARARDGAGNLGRWSRSTCVSTPLDDRAASASASWSRVRGRDAFRQTLTETRRRGERLVVRDVAARQIRLVARTCPGCGVVTVVHGGRELGRVNLASDRVQVPQVFPLRRHHKRLTGRIVIRVISRGKPVQIDGVVAIR